MASRPVLMTLNARIDTLRTPRVFEAIRLAVAGTNAFSPEDFRIVHFSVAPSHVHLIVEARDARTLSSGARSVAIRIARYVNDALSRTGPLWADRWRRRTLASPEDVRRALVEVLANFRQRAPKARAGIDPYSSAAWFDGFRGFSPESGRPPPFVETNVSIAPPSRARPTRRKPSAAPPAENAPSIPPDSARPPTLPPRSALLATGWRKLGLIGLAEAPPAAARAKAGAKRG
jgi:REP element-mobilizing transposase RayT